MVHILKHICCNGSSRWSINLLLSLFNIRLFQGFHFRSNLLRKRGFCSLFWDYFFSSPHSSYLGIEAVWHIFLNHVESPGGTNKVGPLEMENICKRQDVLLGESPEWLKTFRLISKAHCLPLGKSLCSLLVKRRYFKRKEHFKKWKTNTLYIREE